MNQRKALIVLGMHRSGTSALTGVLSILGADPGPSLMPADKSINPKGFWEHVDIVAIHERLLLALGSSWHDERMLPENWWRQAAMQDFRQEITQILRRDFADSSLWILKDPRINRLLPLWLEIMGSLGISPYFVISLRHPNEVAKSLAVRDHFSEQRTSLLWLQHLLDAEKWTRNLPRVLVTFEDLIDDWKAVIRNINASLALDFAFDNPELQQRVWQFLEPSLRHHSYENMPSSGYAARLALQAYETCLVNPLLPHEIFDEISTEVKILADTVTEWSGEIQEYWQARRELAQQLYDCQYRVDVLAKEVVRIRATLSWRVTAPLRFMWNLYCKLTRDG